MLKAQLPSFLSHCQANDLIRLGKDNDGGYIISRTDLIASDFLIGLGLSDDWSFEAEFIKKNNVPLAVYDASVNAQTFFKQVIKSLPRVDSPSLVLKSVKTLLAYKKFFTGTRSQHIQKFVGQSGGAQYIGMDDVFATVPANKIFLKIDIEGWEYRILDSLFAHQNRITGMSIEFHDCDLHLEKIKSFVENIALPIVHIHANNFAPLSDNGLPLVLEISFSSGASITTEKCSYPRPLDMPNNPATEEIELSFDSP